MLLHQNAIKTLTTKNKPLCMLSSSEICDWLLNSRLDHDWNQQR